MLRKDKHDSDFVNEIRNTFEKAKASLSAIVFLDDMDKFANEDRFHRDAEEYVDEFYDADGLPVGCIGIGKVLFH